MWWPWPWINPLDNATDEVTQTSKEAAEAHPPPRLPELPHTESDPVFQALYVHIVQGQIRPEKLWRMRRADLGYIAGHLRPHPDLSPHLAVKLVANGTRALHELERRNFLWSVLLAAGSGAFVAGVIVAISQLLTNH
jgi:hypothetical protein